MITSYVSSTNVQYALVRLLHHTHLWWSFPYFLAKFQSHTLIPGYRGSGRTRSCEHTDLSCMDSPETCHGKYLAPKDASGCIATIITCKGISLPAKAKQWLHCKVEVGLVDRSVCDRGDARALDGNDAMLMKATEVQNPRRYFLDKIIMMW